MRIRPDHFIAPPSNTASILGRRAPRSGRMRTLGSPTNSWDGTLARGELGAVFAVQPLPEMTSLKERLLIRRLQKRDERAFQEMVRLH